MKQDENHKHNIIYRTVWLRFKVLLQGNVEPCDMKPSPFPAVPPVGFPTAKATGCKTECVLVRAQCPVKIQIFRYMLSWQDLLQSVLASFHHDYKRASEGSGWRHWQITASHWMPVRFVAFLCLNKHRAALFRWGTFIFNIPLYPVNLWNQGNNWKAKMVWILSPVLQEKCQFWALFLVRTDPTSKGLCAKPKLSLISSITDAHNITGG